MLFFKEWRLSLCGKTVKKAELGIFVRSAVVLLCMISHPNTLMSRFYGLYRIAVRGVRAHVVYAIDRYDTFLGSPSDRHVPNNNTRTPLSNTGTHRGKTMERYDYYHEQLSLMSSFRWSQLKPLQFTISRDRRKIVSQMNTRSLKVRWKRSQLCERSSLDRKQTYSTAT